MNREVEKSEQQLEKLKDKEAKLEAAIAVRDFPDLKEAIYEIIVTIAKIRKIERGIRALQPGVDLIRAEAAKKQIAFYKMKIEDLVGKEDRFAKQATKFYTDKLQAIFSGGSRKVRYDVVKVQLDSECRNLLTVYAKWKELFEKSGFAVFDYVVYLKEYLAKAEKGSEGIFVQSIAPETVVQEDLEEE